MRLSKRPGKALFPLLLLTYAAAFTSPACKRMAPKELAAEIVSRCNFKLLDKTLGKDDMAGVSKHDVILIKNTIVAKYGKRFKTAYIQQHFQKCSWYKPDHDDVTSLLNDTDRANLALLESLERSLAESERASIPQSLEKFTGFFLRTTPGDLGYPIFLCPNGVYLEPFLCRPGYKKGTWSYTPGNFQYSVTSLCNSTDEGTPTIPPSGCEKVFPKHSFLGCQPPSKAEAGKISTELGLEGFTYIFRQSEVRERHDLRQCDPDFKPLGVADLELLKTH